MKTFNVLNPALAATAILCSEKFTFYKWLGSTVDEMGRDIPNYDEAVTLTGSVQAVPNKMYEQLGLDFNKNYKTVFCSAFIQSIAENIQPDRIIYDGRTYDVVENKNWYETNGWTKILVVEIKSEIP